MFRLTQKQFNSIALAGLAAAFILLALAFASAVTLARFNQTSNERVQHTYRAIGQVALLEAYTERAETAARGYLLAPDPRRIATYRSNRQRIEPTLAEVASLTADNPRQQRSIRMLKPGLLLELATLDRIMAQAIAGDIDGARQQFRIIAAQFNLTTLRDQSDAMAAEERRLLTLREDEARSSVRILTWGLALTGLLLALVALGSGLIVRRFVTDLNQSNDRLNLLNTDLEGEVERRTADLQRANEEIQRFAYIVSHDLRSPLVNILGFTAELETTNKALGGLIAQAEAEAPQLLSPEVREAQTDLPEAIGFIRASTQKMDRLINAILRLSREGRRSLTPELLPMDRVVDEIAGSLSQRLEDAGATLNIHHPLPDMTNDRVAIEQIFSNIIENSIKYGSDDRATVVDLRGSTSDQRVIYEIQDNGRGIAPKDHQRIFELFRRSGDQNRAGEGIGLAQVQALVNRLGGYIDVESSLGEGALFRLNLPVTYVDRGASS
ncbi:MAG: ATP-binding protein [Sphingomicrobium sp.]